MLARVLFGVLFGVLFRVLFEVWAQLVEIDHRVLRGGGAAFCEIDGVLGGLNCCLGCCWRLWRWQALFAADI